MSYIAVVSYVALSVLSYIAAVFYAVLCVATESSVADIPYVVVVFGAACAQ